MMLLFSQPSCNHDAGTHPKCRRRARCVISPTVTEYCPCCFDIRIEDIEGNRIGVYFA